MERKMARFVRKGVTAALCVAFLSMGTYSMAGAGSVELGKAPVPLAVAKGGAQQAGVSIQDSAVPSAASLIYTPKIGNAEVYSGNGATMDASNASEGYINIKYSGNNRKVKVRITRNGSATYTYDLNTNGKYEVFPFTSGSGTYKVVVYTNISGDSYAEALSKSIKVNLRNSFLPFLYPNQYVNFNENSNTVKKAAELARAASDQLGVVQNVYNYCVSNISYDTYKAQTVQSGYLPVVDTILATGKGICFDYAAVMAAMLRSQQIPTRLEIGYVSNGAYHAWISTYIKDVGWINGIIQFDGKNWKMMDPTFAASLGDSGVTQYIGNGTNYKLQYVH